MIQATPTAINYQFPDDNNAVILKRLKASINLSLLANTIIQSSQAVNLSPEPVGYSKFVTALANMGIPPAYLRWWAVRWKRLAFLRYWV